jgi:hypothetical protein
MAKRSKKVEVAPKEAPAASVATAAPERKPVAQQAEEMRLASETCPDCLHMAPRQCRAHRINLPI